MMDQIRTRIESERINARIVPYEVVLQYVPVDLTSEFLELTTLMENMPSKYPGEGDFGIDGPLSPRDQKVWDRYSEIYKIASELAKNAGYQTTDPATKTLSGRLSLRILKLVGNEPRNYHI